MSQIKILLLSYLIICISCTSFQESRLKSYVHQFDKDSQYSSYVLLPSTACKKCVIKMIKEYKCESCLFISPYSEQRKILFPNSNVANVAYDSANSLHKEPFNEDCILIYNSRTNYIEKIYPNNIDSLLNTN